MTPRQQVLHVARQRTYGSRLPTLRYIRSFTRSRGGAWGNPDGGWEHQGVACRASMAGAAWDERRGSVHLYGFLADQLLEVAEAGAARSARLASTTMMIRPCVPPAPVAVPRRPRPPLQYAYCFMQSVRVRVVRVFVGCSVRVPVGEVCVFCSYGFKCRRCGTVCSSKMAGDQDHAPL